MGPLRALNSNPLNGVVTLGHHNGTVTMWTPNMSKPAVKMLCHRGRVSDIAIDREGRYDESKIFNIGRPTHSACLYIGRERQSSLLGLLRLSLMLSILFCHLNLVKV